MLVNIICFKADFNLEVALNDCWNSNFKHTVNTPTKHGMTDTKTMLPFVIIYLLSHNSMLPSLEMSVHENCKPA